MSHHFVLFFRLYGLVVMWPGSWVNAPAPMECIGMITKCNVVKDFWVARLESLDLLLEYLCCFVAVVEPLHSFEIVRKLPSQKKPLNSSGTKKWKF